MTVQELYEQAVKHGFADAEIMVNNAFEPTDVESVLLVSKLETNAGVLLENKVVLK